MKAKPISAPSHLNEAFHYQNPVPFSRGTRVEIGNIVILFISGTASVNEEGKSVHIGDLSKQSFRMFNNVDALLKVEGASWRDAVRTTFYLRDIDRDYQELANLRMQYFKKIGLKVFPASTCVEARLCRPELLVEMEAIAIFELKKKTQKNKRTAKKSRVS